MRRQRQVPLAGLDTQKGGGTDGGQGDLPEAAGQGQGGEVRGQGRDACEPAEEAQAAEAVQAVTTHTTAFRTGPVIRARLVFGRFAPPCVRLAPGWGTG